MKICFIHLTTTAYSILLRFLQDENFAAGLFHHDFVPYVKHVKILTLPTITSVVLTGTPSHFTDNSPLGFVYLFQFEGVPTYPDPGRCWQITDKYNVAIVYTAPTLIRTLMKYGEEPVKK